MKEFLSYLDIFNNAGKVFSIEFKTVELMKEECIFILDTNVLLLPYTVGTKELSEIEKVYKKLLSEDRLYIPAQVAKEFVKNRPKKLEEIYKSISDFLSKVNGFNIPQYPVLGSIKSYINILDLEKDLNQKISDYKKEVKGVLKFIQNINWNDPVSSMYKNIFIENCIYESTYDYQELCKEIDNRHKFNIPPGYKDKGKGDKGIGDFIIWKNMQELSSERSKNIILITGDEKADWFHQSMNTKLYPRYELQYEFYSNTNGNSFNIISLSDLVELFSINNEVVDNIRAVELLNNQYKIYKRVKKQAINRANGKCEVCGMSGIIGNNSILEISHLIPTSKGGEFSINNVAVLCPNCHKKVDLEGAPDELLLRAKKASFIEGSPCEMSGQTCPSCNIGILDISATDSDGVVCNNCGAFIAAPY